MGLLDKLKAKRYSDLHNQWVKLKKSAEKSLETDIKRVIKEIEAELKDMEKNPAPYVKKEKAALAKVLKEEQAKAKAAAEKKGVKYTATKLDNEKLLDAAMKKVSKQIAEKRYILVGDTLEMAFNFRPDADGAPDCNFDRLFPSFSKGFGSKLDKYTKLADKSGSKSSKSLDKAKDDVLRVANDYQDQINDKISVIKGLEHKYDMEPLKACSNFLKNFIRNAG